MRYFYFQDHNTSSLKDATTAYLSIIKKCYFGSLIQTLFFILRKTYLLTTQETSTVKIQDVYTKSDLQFPLELN